MFSPAKGGCILDGESSFLLEQTYLRAAGTEGAQNYVCWPIRATDHLLRLGFEREVQLV
jgi:hypothetical protein